MIATENHDRRVADSEATRNRRPTAAKGHRGHNDDRPVRQKRLGARRVRQYRQGGFEAPLPVTAMPGPGRK